MIRNDIFIQYVQNILTYPIFIIHFCPLIDEMSRTKCCTSQAVQHVLRIFTACYTSFICF